mgnify:CR=1 FL=1
MTVPDCWRASAKLMQKELDRWHECPEKPSLVEAEEKINANTYSACGSKAVAAGLQLAKLCSDFTSEELSFMYKQDVGADEIVDGDADSDADDDDNDNQPSLLQSKQARRKEVDLDTMTKQLRASIDFNKKYEPPVEEGKAEQSVPDCSDHKASALEAQSKGSEQPIGDEINLLTKVAEGKVAKGLRQAHTPADNRRTVGQALRGHETFQQAKADLFRLLAWLRIGPDGCDTDFIRNHYTSHAA